jgi:transcription antitermination factor NusG
MDNHHWYVVQSFPQAEKRASDELRRAGLRVYLPKRTYEVRDRKEAEGRKMRFRPLLIGYLFIRFPDMLLDRFGRPHFAIVRDCQNVRGFVRVADGLGEWKPIAIDDRDVASFMRRQRKREFGRPAIVNRKQRFAELSSGFQRGNQHRVVNGPFASFIATLEKLNENMTLSAEVMIFGRPTKISIGVEDIDPVAEAVAA